MLLEKKISNSCLLVKPTKNFMSEIQRTAKKVGNDSARRERREIQKKKKKLWVISMCNIISDSQISTTELLVVRSRYFCYRVEHVEYLPPIKHENRWGCRFSLVNK